MRNTSLCEGSPSSVSNAMAQFVVPRSMPMLNFACVIGALISIRVPNLAVRQLPMRVNLRAEISLIPKGLNESSHHFSGGFRFGKATRPAGTIERFYRPWRDGHLFFES